MTSFAPSDLHKRLARQSLRRPLTLAEQTLGKALEQVFATGQHDFAAVADELHANNVARPSNAVGRWTPEVLEEELRRINADLDDAYIKFDVMPAAQPKTE